MDVITTISTAPKLAFVVVGTASAAAICGALAFYFHYDGINRNRISDAVKELEAAYAAHGIFPTYKHEIGKKTEHASLVSPDGRVLQSLTRVSIRGQKGTVLNEDTKAAELAALGLVKFASMWRWNRFRALKEAYANLNTGGAFHATTARQPIAA